MGETIGRAKTSVVYRSGTRAQAVISAVVARVREDDGSGERIRFTGSVAFAEETRRHILSDILFFVDSVLRLLGRSLNSYDLSVVNVGFASVAEIPLTVTGRSADASVFLALLSASLGFPISGEMVFTGALAGPDGDIRAVSSLPEKIAAAMNDPTLTCFILPARNADASLSALLPREKERMDAAVARARERLSVREAGSVLDLTGVAVDEDHLALAALRGGYYGRALAADELQTAAGRLAEFLSCDGESRLWRVLASDFERGRKKAARDLLNAWADFHIARSLYPSGAGAELQQLVLSLPPWPKRRRMFPLLSPIRCLALGKIASESDFGDLRLLHDAVHGEGKSRVRRSRRSGHAGVLNKTIVDRVLEEISPHALIESVGRPADLALSSFRLGDVVVVSDMECHEAVTAFYAHLLRHCGSVGECEPDALADAALALLERAFARRGGIRAALALARTGLDGGMLALIQSMTAQWKQDMAEKRVNRILKESVEQDDFESKTAFARALIERLAPLLPEDMQTLNPSQLAHHYEELIRALANSMEDVRALLRSM